MPRLWQLASFTHYKILDSDACCSKLKLRLEGNQALVPQTAISRLERDHRTSVRTKRRGRRGETAIVGDFAESHVSSLAFRSFPLHHRFPCLYS